MQPKLIKSSSSSSTVVVFGHSRRSKSQPSLLAWFELPSILAAEERGKMNTSLEGATKGKGLRGRSKGREGKGREGKAHRAERRKGRRSFPLSVCDLPSCRHACTHARRSFAAATAAAAAALSLLQSEADGRGRGRRTATASCCGQTEVELAAGCRPRPGVACFLHNLTTTSSLPPLPALGLCCSVGSKTDLGRLDATSNCSDYSISSAPPVFPSSIHHAPFPRPASVLCPAAPRRAAAQLS